MERFLGLSGGEPDQSSRTGIRIALTEKDIPLARALSTVIVGVCDYTCAVIGYIYIHMS
jgi:hypothetical protein